MISIRTKAQYPFLYFFVEPNIVFVLKLESDHYATFTTISECGEWLTYELNDGEEFDSFHHDKHAPLEGRGYFLAQDHVNIVVEEINNQIQLRRRQLRKRGKDSISPIHLVCTESAAGSLKVGLPRPKEVIGFPDFFSIGPLWKLHEKMGQANRNEWLYENINLMQDEYDYINKFTNALREIEDLSDKPPIYLWVGNNADEQIGLRFFLYLLRNKPNEIFVINSTKQSLSDETNPVFSTGQLNPEQSKEIFAKSQSLGPLTAAERVQMEREWEALEGTKEVLRIWENEKIVGVSDDYFDPLLMSVIDRLHAKQETKDFIRAGEVIGEILEQSNLFVNIFYLEYRLRALIYGGALELKGIPKSMRHYWVKMR